MLNFAQILCAYVPIILSALREGWLRHERGQPQEQMEVTMFCPNCGKQIPDGSRFCPECGATLNAAGGNVPPVSSGTTPSSYDSLGTSYQTPPTMVDPNGLAGRPPKKKGHGAAVAAVVVILVAVVAIIMLTPIHKSIPGLANINLLGGNSSSVEQPAQGTGSGGSNSGSTGSGVAAGGSSGNTSGGSSSSSGSGSTTVSGTSPLVGTWTGNLSGDSSIQCVSSQTKTPTVTIKSVDPSTGTVKADISFNFHNHDSSQDTTADGDEQTDLKDLEFMLSNTQTQDDGQIVAGDFQYKPSLTAEYGPTAECSFSGEIAAKKLTIRITERGGDGNTGYSSYADTYVLTKQ